MIINKNIVSSLPLSDVCEREVLRYAKTNESDLQSCKILRECKNELLPLLKSLSVFRIVEVKRDENELRIADIPLKSNSISNLLKDAEYAVLFVASIGLGADIFISKYEKISIAKAHISDALATERIESLCDAVDAFIKDELKKEGYETTHRFSAGYGDLGIEFQREIFKILTPEKHIGVTLNESLIMSPSKSVSAIIGVKKINQ